MEQDLLVLGKHLEWMDETGNYESQEQTGKEIEHISKRIDQILKELEPVRILQEMLSRYRG